MNLDSNYNPWPELPYNEFLSTKYLLHMLAQMIGKLKLSTPFEPHWANVGLWLSGLGLTTGAVPYQSGVYCIDVDLISHKVHCTSSWGKTSQFDLKSQSVAELFNTLQANLKSMGVEMNINPMPREIPNPISFHQDMQVREYNKELANAWWRIMASSYQVLLRYHSHFKGISPTVCLMWGTFDLRDARYLNRKISTEGMGFITRNAYDAPQVEVGWWSGDERYTRPAYFSFIYPKAEGMELMQILPDKARWDHTLNEFILDYDDVRTSPTPEADLLAFFESTYRMEAEKAEWDVNLIATGEPV